ncbi:hypothetical protein [Hymenobacter terricola]|uniref:hypothetical protein n=1 Tax=Hymenobacter terricola TaxID=2819236 RepID=UPI001B303020|nr:hypothetical protein [Hymenobacter terricola]
MKRFFPLLLGAGWLLGCQNDTLLFVSPTSVTELNSLLLPNAPAVQTFGFTLSQPQTLHTAAGATLSFPANAFVLPNGSVATGRAELRVRELRSVGDMVLAGLNTNVALAANRLLVSAGEVNLQVWQGSTRLRWKPALATGPAPAGPSLAFPVPTGGLDTTRMFLWNLPVAGNPAAAPADSMAGWQPALLTGQSAWSPLLQANGFYTAALPLDTISWINFDQYWRPAAGPAARWTWAQVRVPAGATETRVFLRPAGYTSLCRTFGTPGDPTLWSNHFPEGTDVQAIVLQARDGQLYFGTQRYTWQQNAVMAPPLQALSAADIVQRIRQL